jgi:MFS family permease
MTLATYRALLANNPNFRRLWFAQIVSELGDWFYSVAIYSFLLETTGSALSVATAFVMQVLPQTLASPLAGVLNDRLSRRKVMLFADFARAFIVAAMLLVRTRDMAWLLFVLLFLETVMWALFEPGRSAVIAVITKDEQTLAANALSATTWSVNFALGTAIGGVATAFLGRDAVFVFNSLSFVLSGLLILRMRFPEPHLAGAPPLRPRDLVDFSPVADGLRYVRTDSRLAATMMVKGGMGLLGANWVILPLFGERVFPVRLEGLTSAQAASLGMSVLLGSRGVGSVLGAFGSTFVSGGDSARMRRLIWVGFGLAGAGYLLLGVAANVWLAALSLVLAHAGGSAIWTQSSSLLMRMTEDRFRGRVFSAEFALSMFTLSLASYAAGLASDAGVGIRTVAIASGIVMLLPGAGWLAAQRLWRGEAGRAG